LTNKSEIDLEQAYSVETPEDNVQLYGDWAATYDSDFVASKGYVYHLHVVDQLAQHIAEINGAVLDVGCGTGVVGVALQEKGIGVIDGIDISPAMLAESANKKTAAGNAVYRQLIRADLTKSIAIPDNHYGGLISSGTFTHGHLGPEALSELWRVAAPGAVCVIGINARHYDLMGFGEKFAADVANGNITSPEFSEIEIYATAAGDADHGNDTALVAVCKTL